MERQLLEIQDAFAAFVDDAERQKHDAEGRLREAARTKADMEDRLRTIERQKQELEDQLRETAGQLRKLQKTPAMRIVRFFRRLNPVTIGAEANLATAPDHGEIHARSSIAASRSASARSSTVLALKNGSNGSAGHATVASR